MGEENHREGDKDSACSANLNSNRKNKIIWDAVRLTGLQIAAWDGKAQGRELPSSSLLQVRKAEKEACFWRSPSQVDSRGVWWHDVDSSANWQHLFDFLFPGSSESGPFPHNTSPTDLHGPRELLGMFCNESCRDSWGIMSHSPPTLTWFIGVMFPALFMIVQPESPGPEGPATDPFVPFCRRVQFMLVPCIPVLSS